MQDIELAFLQSIVLPSSGINANSTGGISSQVGALLQSCSFGLSSSQSLEPWPSCVFREVGKLSSTGVLCTVPCSEKTGDAGLHRLRPRAPSPTLLSNLSYRVVVMEHIVSLCEAGTTFDVNNTLLSPPSSILVFPLLVSCIPIPHPPQSTYIN